MQECFASPEDGLLAHLDWFTDEPGVEPRNAKPRHPSAPLEPAIPAAPVPYPAARSGGNLAPAAQRGVIFASVEELAAAAAWIPTSPTTLRLTREARRAGPDQ